MRAVHAAANGADYGGSIDAQAMSTERCSGSVENAQRCLRFGTVALLRGMYTSVGPAIDGSIADE